MNYNLAENLMQDESFTDLRYEPIFNLVQNFIQKDEVVNEIVNLRKEESYGNWNDFEIKLADSIIKKADDESHNSVIRSAVSIVASDVYSMYWKVRDYNEYRLLLKYIVLNRQDGSLNLHKTVLKMLENSSMSTELKFEIACKYFVGKEIIIKYGKQIPASIRSSMYCSDPYCVRCIPLKFWQVYLDDVSDSALSSSSENIPTKRFKAEEKKHHFVFYFKWALYSANDIALQYLVENLNPTSEEKINCNAFTHKALTSFGMSNIIAYLISKKKHHQLLYVENIQEGDQIMENFLRNGRWHKYISTIVKASRNKIPISFSSQCIGFVAVLHNSIHKNLDTNMYRRHLEELLQIVPTEGLVLENLRECKDDVLYPILKIMDFEALKILMKIYKETDVSNLLYSNVGLRLYHKKICECAFTEIESFLKKVFKSDEAMSKYLSRVVDDCYLSFCERFVFNKNMEQLDLFSKWCDKFVPDVLSNKRMRLSCKSNGNVLRQIFFSTPNRFENPYEYADKFLLWCLGYQEAVDEFKRCIVFKRHNVKDEKKAHFGLYFYDDFRRCVEMSQYELLNKFIKWSGCDDRTINLLKSQMSRDTRIPKHFCASSDSAGFWRFLRWVKDEME